MQPAHKPTETKVSQTPPPETRPSEKPKNTHIADQPTREQPVYKPAQKKEPQTPLPAATPPMPQEDAHVATVPPPEPAPAQKKPSNQSTFINKEDQPSTSSISKQEIIRAITPPPLPPPTQQEQMERQPVRKKPEPRQPIRDENNTQPQGPQLKSAYSDSEIQSILRQAPVGRTSSVVRTNSRPGPRMSREFLVVAIIILCVVIALVAYILVTYNAAKSSALLPSTLLANVTQNAHGILTFRH